MSAKPGRWQPTDFEAYCFLKRYLPLGYSVQSEPSTAYFSEWQFCYRIYRGADLVKELSGDFRKITPGTLADEAITFLTLAESA